MWWGVLRVWGLRVQQVLRGLQEQRDEQEPAEAWSESCAEQQVPPGGQELREPAEQ